MLATPERPFVYGRQGGSAPPSFELLTILSDGSARYVAGNPWPAQPPFDEIGVYEWSVPPPARCHLQELAAMAGTEVGSGSRSYDSGIEYVDAWAAGRTYEAEWNPAAAPAATAALTGAVRALITEGRGSPASVLHARLEAPDSGREAAVILSPGGRGFRLGCRGDANEGPQVRLRATGSGDLAEPSGIPARLASLEPVEPRGEFSPDNPDGTLDLAPGDSIRLLVPFRRLPQPGRARLEALVRVEFPLTSLAGEDYMQVGWLVPQAEWLPGQGYHS